MSFQIKLLSVASCGLVVTGSSYALTGATTTNRTIAHQVQLNSSVRELPSPDLVRKIISQFYAHPMRWDWYLVGYYFNPLSAQSARAERFLRLTIVLKDKTHTITNMVAQFLTFSDHGSGLRMGRINSVDVYYSYGGRRSILTTIKVRVGSAPKDFSVISFKDNTSSYRAKATYYNSHSFSTPLLSVANRNCAEYNCIIPHDQMNHFYWCVPWQTDQELELTGVLNWLELHASGFGWGANNFLSAIIKGSYHVIPAPDIKSKLQWDMDGVLSFLKRYHKNKWDNPVHFNFYYENRPLFNISFPFLELI